MLVNISGIGYSVPMCAEHGRKRATDVADEATRMGRPERRSVVIVGKAWRRAARLSIDSRSVIASRLLRAGAKTRARRRLMTERGR